MKILLGVLMAMGAWGQSFEVASVKVSAPFTPGRGLPRGGGPNDPEHLSLSYMTMELLLERAYGMKEYQISGPAWLTTEHYDVAATMAPGTSKEQQALMLQSLLAQRFGLKVHRETREIPVYDLVVGKGGPKFKESPPDAPAPATAATDPKTANGTPIMKRGADGIIELPASMNGKGHVALRSMFGTEIRVRHEGLAYLIERLTADLGRPVTDKTGLTGKYDYAVAYMPESMLAAAAARSGASAANPNSPAASGGVEQEARTDLFTALQSHLGLKLEQRKAPGEVLVVDHAEKVPTEN